MNIFNLSFGKDSMATLLLALEQGVKVDRVMYADIRFDSEISGEHPIMAEWIPTAENTFMPDIRLAEITKNFESGYVPKRKKTIAKYKQTSIFDKE